MDEHTLKHFVKGKITEFLFMEMFKEDGEFLVIPAGYEHTIPELAQYQKDIGIKDLLDTFRKAPDFVLINADKKLPEKQVFLVEVKFQSSLDISVIEKEASEVVGIYPHAWLFVATPEGFYFSSCNSIRNNKRIDKMADSWISQERQDKYLNILRDFI